MDSADKEGYDKDTAENKSWNSTRQLAKMGRGEDVSTDVLRKICATLDCTLDDIVEMLPDEPNT